MNRFRSFFQVLQFLHLPFTHQWPSGAFVYWISSSTFVLIQQSILKKPYFLNKINPNFFFDYQKMYGERSPQDHENIVERVLNIEDPTLKKNTQEAWIKEDLENEMRRFAQLQRQLKIKALRGNYSAKQDTPDHN